jgi:hypothetical protein
MKHAIVTTTALAGLSIAGLAVAACSSSGSSSSGSSSSASSSSASTATTSGTETLHGADTGSAAAASLNSNSNAPLQFRVFTYSGLVNLTVKPFTLPGGNGPIGTNTLPGGLRVHHVSVLPSSSSNAPPPTTWTLKGGNCYFTSTFDKGSYTVVTGSTGKFAGATGHGSYLITATGSAPLAKGKTTCSFSSTGPVSAQGASITFSASGPLTVP